MPNARRRYRNGFVLTRTLVALFITVTILPLALTTFIYCANLDCDYNLVNNELALMDLRRVLLISYDIEVNEHELNFLYHNDNYSLSLINEKLILQPGTQIYLNDIDDVSFYTKSGSIYLAYSSKGKEYERNIGKEKGIYLDDFSNDDGELSEHNDG